MDGLLFLLMDEDEIPLREARVLWERENPFLKFNNTEFRRNFRLAKPTLLNLVDLLRPDLEFPNRRGCPLSPIQQVCLCLQYFATGTCLIFPISRVFELLCRASTTLIYF